MAQSAIHSPVFPLAVSKAKELEGSCLTTCEREIWMFYAADEEVH